MKHINKVMLLGILALFTGMSQVEGAKAPKGFFLEWLNEQHTIAKMSHPNVDLGTITEKTTADKYAARIAWIKKQGINTLINVGNQAIEEKFTKKTINFETSLQETVSSIKAALADITSANKIAVYGNPESIRISDETANKIAVVYACIRLKTEPMTTATDLERDEKLKNMPTELQNVVKAYQKEITYDKLVSLSKIIEASSMSSKLKSFAKKAAITLGGVSLAALTAYALWTMNANTPATIEEPKTGALREKFGHYTCETINGEPIHGTCFFSPEQEQTESPNVNITVFGQELQPLSTEEVNFYCGNNTAENATVIGNTTDTTQFNNSSAPGNVPAENATDNGTAITIYNPADFGRTAQNATIIDNTSDLGNVSTEEGECYASGDTCSFDGEQCEGTVNPSTSGNIPAENAGYWKSFFLGVFGETIYNALPQ